MKSVRNLVLPWQHSREGVKGQLAENVKLTVFAHPLSSRARFVELPQAEALRMAEELLQEVEAVQAVTGRELHRRAWRLACERCVQLRERAEELA